MLWKQCLGVTFIPSGILCMGQLCRWSPKCNHGTQWSRQSDSIGIWYYSSTYREWTWERPWKLNVKYWLHPTLQGCFMGTYYISTRSSFLRTLQVPHDQSHHRKVLTNKTGYTSIIMLKAGMIVRSSCDEDLWRRIRLIIVRSVSSNCPRVVDIGQARTHSGCAGWRWPAPQIFFQNLYRR